MTGWGVALTKPSGQPGLRQETQLFAMGGGGDGGGGLGGGGLVAKVASVGLASVVGQCICLALGFSLWFAALSPFHAFCCLVLLALQDPRLKGSLRRFQELQRELPAPAFFTSAHDCTVACRVGPNPLFAHRPQKSKCMLPLAPLLASTDCLSLIHI